MSMEELSVSLDFLVRMCYIVLFLFVRRVLSRSLRVFRMFRLFWVLWILRHNILQLFASYRGRNALTPHKLDCTPLRFLWIT